MLGRSLPDIDDAAGRGLLSRRTASLDTTVELPGTDGARLGLSD